MSVAAALLCQTSFLCANNTSLYASWRHYVSIDLSAVCMYQGSLYLDSFQTLNPGCMQMPLFAHPNCIPSGRILNYGVSHSYQSFDQVFKRSEYTGRGSIVSAKSGKDSWCQTWTHNRQDCALN